MKNPARTSFGLSVPSGTLQRLLRIVGPFAGTRTAVPILNTVLLEASAKDGLVISATDLDVGIVVQDHTPGVVAAFPGRIVLPYLALDAIVKRLPVCQVRIRMEGPAVIMDYGDGGQCTFTHGFQADDFPTLLTLPKDAPILFDAEPKTLRDEFNKVRFAISREYSKYTLSGALLEVPKNGAFALVATDGHRLVRQVFPPRAVKQQRKIIFSRRFMDVVCASIGNDTIIEKAVVSVSEGSDMVFCSWHDTVIQSRAVTGLFPNYQPILEMAGKDRGSVFTVCASVLYAAIQRLVPATTVARAFELDLSPHGCAISASNELYRLGESIDSEYAGEEMKVAFKCDYLLDFLPLLGDALLTMRFKDKESLVLFESEAFPDYQYVLMPMRL